MADTTAAYGAKRRHHRTYTLNVVNVAWRNPAPFRLESALHDECLELANNASGGVGGFVRWTLKRARVVAA